MATGTDHIRRDAEHAARNCVSTELGKFSRRINEAAKANIASRLAAVEDGANLSFDFGTQVGEEEAHKAILDFLYDDPESTTPRASIEAKIGP